MKLFLLICCCFCNLLSPTFAGKVAIIGLSHMTVSQENYKFTILKKPYINNAQFIAVGDSSTLWIIATNAAFSYLYCSSDIKFENGAMQIHMQQIKILNRSVDFKGMPVGSQMTVNTNDANEIFFQLFDDSDREISTTITLKDFCAYYQLEEPIKIMNKKFSLPPKYIAELLKDYDLEGCDANNAIGLPPFFPADNKNHSNPSKSIFYTIGKFLKNIICHPVSSVCAFASWIKSFCSRSK
jgi:hypothetical protein